MKTIATARLMLRPFRWGDLEEFHRLAYADPEVAPWWTGRTKTTDEIRASFARKVEQPPGEPGWLAVTLKGSDALVGGQGLQRWLPDEDTSWLIPEHPEDALWRDPRVIEVELAYVLGRDHWGHGYATEAGRAVLAYGFGELGVERVLSPINSANRRSITLAQRLGCRIHRNLHPRPSRFRDTPGVIAVLTRSDWSSATRDPEGAGRAVATATLSTRASALAPHRFTAAEYYRMAEAGILGEDDQVELIGGQIVDMSPINPPHAAAVSRCLRVFTRAAGDRALIRTQNPLDLGEYDAPEPDLALVQPRADDYATAHPTAAAVLLVVEVWDSSLAYDWHVKLPLYAASGVREAWLLNLQERRLEVSQEPREDGYAGTRVYRASERVFPLAFPELELAVADLLPPGAVKPCDRDALGACPCGAPRAPLSLAGSHPPRPLARGPSTPRGRWTAAGPLPLPRRCRR